MYIRILKIKTSVDFVVGIIDMELIKDTKVTWWDLFWIEFISKLIVAFSGGC